MATPAETPVDAKTLAAWVVDARQRTFSLICDLTDEQLMAGWPLQIVNPLLWEIGHVAWFYEKWILRHTLGRAPVRPDADSLFDSMAIAHDTRWDLPLPSRAETLAYMQQVQDSVLDVLEKKLDPRVAYFAQYSVFHEDMHTEAFTYTRQTLGLPPPRFGNPAASRIRGAGHDVSASSPAHSNSRAAPTATVVDRTGGDVEIPGGTFPLGACDDGRFVFDNEKWAHPLRLDPFAISRTAVTQSEFAAFVEDGGYRRPALWDAAGRRWLRESGAQRPVYWKREGSGWLRRHFDRWVELEPNRPVIHVNRHEAGAFCRWAGRRLPTEAEWEAAAAALPAASGGGLTREKRPYPWGNDLPGPERARLDWQGMGTVEVDCLPAGDSAFGCRQMIGNVWEWTADDFRPYPGFRPDPYKEYSQPWFHTHKVLRGGCWATRSRLVRNTLRNYYTPERRDVWAGFRTCAPKSCQS